MNALPPSDAAGDRLARAAGGSAALVLGVHDAFLKESVGNCLQSAHLLVPEWIAMFYCLTLIAVRVLFRLAR
jgi:hypothetical protein